MYVLGASKAYVCLFTECLSKYASFSTLCMSLLLCVYVCLHVKSIVQINIRPRGEIARRSWEGPSEAGANNFSFPRF